MRYDLTDISAMIENYRNVKQHEKEPVEYSLVDAFQHTLTGLYEHFELMNRGDLNEDAQRVVCVGKRLLQDAYAEIEKTCLIMEAALGDVRILYGCGSRDGAEDIVDVVIKDKYVVPKGAGDDVGGTGEGRLSG